MRALLWVGAALVLAGIFLCVTPVYGPRPSAEPYFQGTLWTAGLPLALVGLVVLGLGVRRARQGATAAS